PPLAKRACRRRFVRDDEVRGLLQPGAFELLANAREILQDRPVGVGPEAPVPEESRDEHDGEGRGGGAWRFGSREGGKKSWERFFTTRAPAKRDPGWQTAPDRAFCNGWQP